MSNNHFFDGNGITGATETGKTINMAYPHKNRSDRVQNLIVEHDGELFGRPEFMGKTYAEMQAEVLGAENRKIMNAFVLTRGIIDPERISRIRIPEKPLSKEEVRSALKGIDKLLVDKSKPYFSEFKIGPKK